MKGMVLSRDFAAIGDDQEPAMCVDSRVHTTQKQQGFRESRDVVWSLARPRG